MAKRKAKAAKAAEVKKAGYEAVKARSAARSKALSAAGRDIGPTPPIADAAARAAASASFKVFCETYMAETFYLPWSPDHLKVIAKIEQAVLRGGLFALAMPRTSGKTVLCEAACLWAIVIGARKFVVLIGPDEKLAENMMASIMVELASNEKLGGDFPEVCHPIAALEGITNRASGQTCGGQQTHIRWTKKRLVLATVPAEVLAEAGIPEQNGTQATISVTGITGGVRGMKHKQPTGTTVRPDLVVLDDPQTDESARSVSQCADRESILAGAVLGLAGPKKKISGLMPCTVIRPGDMADRILNRDMYPQWQGERMKMVYAFPTAEKLWDEYADLRRQSFREDHRGEEATEFYRQRQAEMDAGARVAWPELFNEDEVSGVQHAMNLKIDSQPSEEAFWAECQNEPKVAAAEGPERMTADQVMAKLNRRKRGEVPLGCEHVTAFVDVHERLLFWLACAWQPDFTGYLLDYGTYPDQQVAYFNGADAQRTLRRAHPGAGIEGAIYAGLESLVGTLATREWPREDGAPVRTGLILVDQGWQTALVHQFCRQSAHGGLLMPSRGRGVTAAQKSVDEYDRGRGDRIGHHWWMPLQKGARALRHIEVDTNYWKSFLHERIGTAMGDRGCFSLFGDLSGTHRLMADHLTAEYFEVTQGRGRTVQEWRLKPGRADNHWLDCLVGCAVGASIQGAALRGVAGGAIAAGTQKKQIVLSEIQRERQREKSAWQRQASRGRVLGSGRRF